MESKQCPSCKVNPLKRYFCGSTWITMCSSLDCTYPLEMDQSYWMIEKHSVPLASPLDTAQDTASIHKQSDSSESIAGELLDMSNHNNDTESCDMNFIDELLGSTSTNDENTSLSQSSNMGNAAATIAHDETSSVISDFHSQYMTTIHHRSISLPLIFWKPTLQRDLWLKLLHAILLHCTAFQVPQDCVGNITNSRYRSSFMYRLAMLQFNYAICLKELQQLSLRSSATDQSASSTMEDLTNFAKESWSYFTNYFDFIDKFAATRHSLSDALIDLLECKDSMIDENHNNPHNCVTFREKFELSFVNDLSCSLNASCGLSVQRSSSYLHVSRPLSKSFSLSNRDSLSSISSCPKCTSVNGIEPVRTSKISWWKLSSCLIVRFSGKPQFRVFNINEELNLREEGLIPTVLIDCDNTLWLRHCENLNYWLKLSVASPHIVHYNHDEMFTHGFAGLELVILERQSNRSVDVYPNPDFHQIANMKAESVCMTESNSSSSRSRGRKSTKRKLNSPMRGSKQNNHDYSASSSQIPSKVSIPSSADASVNALNNKRISHNMSATVSDGEKSNKFLLSSSNPTGSSSPMAIPMRASCDSSLPGSSTNFLLTRYLANQVHKAESSDEESQRSSPSTRHSRGRSLCRRLAHQVRVSSRSPSPNNNKKYHPIRERDALQMLINSKLRACTSGLPRS